MSPSSKKKGKKGKGGSRGKASQDFASTPGRGPNVPRMNLGRDTLLGLAQSQRRTLSFVGSAAISGAAGVYAENTVNMNNAFSVFGGASAIGYAKYMAFYSKCFVLGSTIHAKGVVIDNAATAGLVAGVTLSTNSTSLASFPAAIENGMCDWTVAFNLPDRFDFKQSVEVSKFLNKPRILDDPQLFSTSSASPTQLVVAHIWTQPTGGATAINFSVVFQVDLDCVFTDPIPFT